MERIFSWIKTVSTLLIVLSLIRNLLPGKSYNAYFNAFLGMLVVYVICSPLSGDYTIGDVVLNGLYSMENLGSVYSEEELSAFSYSFTASEYEKILRMEICDEAENAGFEVADVEVVAETDGTCVNVSSVTITCSSAGYTQEEIDVLREGLAELLGMDVNNIICFY